MISLTSLAGKKQFTVVLLIAIAISGFYIRFDNLNHWLDNKSQYFTSTGLPVALGVDSYYYLDIAEDLLKGKISKFDDQRHYPSGSTKPNAVPLLSVLIALIAFVSSKPLEWVAVLLPPFLGILLAIPAYCLGYTLAENSHILWRKKRIPITSPEAKFVGFSTALFTLLSPAFVLRSSIGFCDTDTLNVVFTTLSIFLALRFSISTNPLEKIRLFAYWSIVLLIFTWWWDQSLLPVLVMATIPMFIGVIISWRDIHRDIKPYAIAISAVVFALIAIKGSSLLTLPENFISLFNYIIGNETNLFFPSPESLVWEQESTSFVRLASSVAGNNYLYMFSLAGLGIALLVSGKKFIFLFPLLICNILAFSAARFMAFLAPLFGIGIAYAILALLVSFRRAGDARVWIFLPVILWLGWYPFNVSQEYNSRKPILAPAIYEAMQKISDKTPIDSVVWSSWGQGHPLVYYSKRKTIADGMYHTPFVDFVTKYPFAEDNFRLAANWIQFYTVNGEKGLSMAFHLLAGDDNDWATGFTRLTELLAAGVSGARTILRDKYRLNVASAETFLKSLFPVNSPPIYIFTNYRLITENWYNLGKWDFTRKAYPTSYTLTPVYSYHRGRQFLYGSTGNGTYSLNLNSGVGKVNNSALQLVSMRIEEGEKSFELNYPRKIGRYFYMIDNKVDKVSFGLFADHRVKNTLLVKLFFEKYSAQGFFKPLFANPPLYLISEVLGEKYAL